MRSLVAEWRNVALDARERAICDFAEALTRAPGHVREPDLAPLRAAGLDDAGISDLVQVIAYFNYINRVADGLGIDPEEHVDLGAPRGNHGDHARPINPIRFSGEVP